jgi:signal-transduction protein with cAMP-binding, CBS, and nucleotidyltransferase domain
MDPDTGSLERIDSFPYRHRIAELMSKPVVTAPPTDTVGAASRLMLRSRVGSLIVVDGDGRAEGVVTEHDVLRALARDGAGAVDTPLGDVMSAPVATVPEDSYLYVAFGRMPRLGVNHLLVVDEDRRPVGMISASTVMRLRASRAIVVGDEVAAADGADALRAAWRKVPSLAAGLLAEDVDAPGVAAVISALVRDITRRAAELAEQAMAEAGWGPAPAAWCALVLGSGGRGESALAPDQDNAIVHAGGEADDAWFAEAGRRIAETLDRAGIPLCKGGVMAGNAAWRRTLDGWKEEVQRWIRKKQGESLLNVDIFFDLAGVAGERRLASELRRFAFGAARSPLFLKLLAADLENMHSPLGAFGRIRTEQGRFDIKKGGLLPITTAARVLALKHGVEASSTKERLASLAAAGAVNAADAANLAEAHGALMRTLLDQQLADSRAGLPPTTLVDPKRLASAARARLKAAFRQADLVPAIVETALRRA